LFYKNLNNGNIIIEICSFRKNVLEWKMFIYEICSNMKFVLIFEMIKFELFIKQNLFTFEKYAYIKLVQIKKLINFMNEECYKNVYIRKVFI
jgi:hypothetical protein